MKVYINNYKHHWISPYTIVEYMFFWTDWSKCARNKYAVPDENWVESPRWSNTLADNLNWLSIAIQWVWDKIDRKIDYVKVDRWDTYSADSTLAIVILPVLKQLKADKHGYPLVADEDVPEHIRSDKCETIIDDMSTGWDDNAEARYDWVLDEMIFAFECLVDDSWEDKFYSGKHDYQWVDTEGGLKQLTKGPNDTFKWDKEGWLEVNKRIDNGLILFGKYFRSLWT